MLAIVYLPYFVLFIFRKSHKRPNELRNQFLFGFISLGLAIITEFIAVNLYVWTYFPRNWPIVLWPAYFGAGLSGYQIVKAIEGNKR